jgi:hypothetical protein
MLVARLVFFVDLLRFQLLCILCTVQPLHELPNFRLQDLLSC